MGTEARGRHCEGPLYGQAVRNGMHAGWQAAYDFLSACNLSLVRHFMELGKVQARGQITLPQAVRWAAGIEAGDLVSLVVTAPGTVELRVVSRLRLADALERYPVTAPVDDMHNGELWQVEAAKDVLGP